MFEDELEPDDLGDDPEDIRVPRKYTLDSLVT